jgi:ferritin-like metal-binding protein YciE
MKDFYDLFIEELKKMYAAEKEIVKTLPKVIKAVKSNEFKKALAHHLQETKHQVKRLELIGKEIRETLTGGNCSAMKALLKEGEKFIKGKYHPMVRDAALINCCQQVEHYEIAAYGSLKAHARQFKFFKVERLLDDSSQEEGNADKKMIELAKGTNYLEGINKKAKRSA